MKHTAGLFLIFLLLVMPTPAGAQNTPAVPHPEKIKILDEYSDGKGNIVRKVQYKQGNFIVSETIIMPKITKARLGIRIPVNPDTLIKDSLLVIVDKSDYMVTLQYRRRTLRTYKAVFGPRPLVSKCMEGDRCTPEGQFKIVSKNGASKYDRFMGLSYPDAAAQKRFASMKADGLIPATARIGGDVGIHGIWPGGDDMIEMGIGWTDGCIALKNKDVEELYSFIGVGTKVLVQK